MFLLFIYFSWTVSVKIYWPLSVVTDDIGTPKARTPKENSCRGSTRYLISINPTNLIHYQVLLINKRLALLNQTDFLRKL